MKYRDDFAPMNVGNRTHDYYDRSGNLAFTVRRIKPKLYELAPFGETFDRKSEARLRGIKLCRPATTSQPA